MSNDARPATGSHSRNRISKADKARYLIGPNPWGYWAGECPTCGYGVAANDYSVPQAAIAYALGIHEKDKHSG